MAQSDLNAELRQRAEEAAESIRSDARAAWLASRAEQGGAATPEKTEVRRRIELSTDLQAARRAAREQWLTERNARDRSADATRPEPANVSQPAPRLVLPDDELAK